ncbi:MAG: hypothetical protein LLG04_04285, partial [Parachlamydia sp.]|nr:hypothetical protein [Parachlamydia sp.]
MVSALLLEMAFGLVFGLHLEMVFEMAFELVFVLHLELVFGMVFDLLLEMAFVTASALLAVCLLGSSRVCGSSYCRPGR